MKGWYYIWTVNERLVLYMNSRWKIDIVCEQLIKGWYCIWTVNERLVLHMTNGTTICHRDIYAWMGLQCNGTATLHCTTVPHFVSVDVKVLTIVQRSQCFISVVDTKTKCFYGYFYWQVLGWIWRLTGYSVFASKHFPNLSLNLFPTRTWMSLEVSSTWPEWALDSVNCG